MGVGRLSGSGPRPESLPRPQGMSGQKLLRIEAPAALALNGQDAQGPAAAPDDDAGLVGPQDLTRGA